MIIQKDNYLISVESDYSQLAICGANGQSFKIDVDYNNKTHRTQIGKVVALPIKVTEQYINDNPLQIGDTILFSHLVIDNAHRFAEHIYRCEHYNIFAKLNNGILEPLEDFIFCEKMYEEQNGILKKAERVSNKYAKVLAPSKTAYDFGVRADDKLYFTHNADYTLKVNGMEFIRVRKRNVIGVERNGELVALGDKALIKRQELDRTFCGFVVLAKRTSQKRGTILKSNIKNSEINIGDTVAYYSGTSSDLTWQGNDYAFVTIDNIKFVYGK